MGDDQGTLEGGNAIRDVLQTVWRNDNKTARAVKLAFANDLCRRSEWTATRKEAGDTMSKHWNSLTKSLPFPGVVKLLRSDKYFKLDTHNGKPTVTLQLPSIPAVFTAGMPQEVSARRNSRRRQKEPLHRPAKRRRQQCSDAGNLEMESECLNECLEHGAYTTLREDAALAPITPPSMDINHQHCLLHCQPLQATVTFNEQHRAQYALVTMPGSLPETDTQQSACTAQPVASAVPPEDHEALSMAQLLPPMVRQQLLAVLAAPDHNSRQLKEVTVDQGRPVQLRFMSGKPQELPPVNMDDALMAISHAVGRTFVPGRPCDPFFRSDNRLTLSNSLHRISAQRGSSGQVDGITYRVGRHIPGAARMATDLLARLSGTCSDSAAPPGSLLLIGRPGVGKTTLLRDVCRVLADDMHRAVHIVDTSNEIAGDGEVPHECIGMARRMSVPERGRQAELMLQVVTNHGPEVVVVDEIGGRDEVAAVRTIAQRGVMLVASAHGSTLEDLLRNPDLNPLLGGIQAVILSDAAAKRGRQVDRKTRSERKGAPAFAAAIEVLGHGRWRVHHDLRASVDAMLMGQPPDTQLREYAPDGTMRVTFETLGAAISAGMVQGRGGLRSSGGGALEGLR